MSPDALFWATISLKMALTAGFVVAAAAVVERAAMLGALIATLPIAAGPAYILLALDHDAAFVAESARASLAVNAATATFALAYAALAQRQNVAVSVLIPLLLWIAFALIVRWLDWPLAGALLLNGVVFAICIPAARRFLDARVPPIARRWYDIPLRALMVTCLVAAVVTASARVGPALTGMLAVFPVVLLSLMLILQPRIGGRAAAAVLANGILGLAGFAVALVTLAVSAVPLGAPAALTLALAVSLTWNIVVWGLRRRRLLARAAAKDPSLSPSP